MLEISLEMVPRCDRSINASMDWSSITSVFSRCNLVSRDTAARRNGLPSCAPERCNFLASSWRMRQGLLVWQRWVLLQGLIQPAFKSGCRLEAAVQSSWHFLKSYLKVKRWACWHLSLKELPAIRFPISACKVDFMVLPAKDASSLGKKNL